MRAEAANQLMPACLDMAHNVQVCCLMWAAGGASSEQPAVPLKSATYQNMH